MTLSLDVICAIRNTNKSYREIIRVINERFGVHVAKSTISYYRKTKNRILPININKLKNWELEWLIGLYFADGCKYFEKHSYGYTIKFILDLKNDTIIVKRLLKFLRNIGVKPVVSIGKGTLIIRIYSKMLYEFFPLKNQPYIPKDVYGFLAGLIDGDGYVSKGSKLHVIISQQGHREIMSYLMRKLGLSRSESMCMGSWGMFNKVNYYVPVKVARELYKKKYSVKINRHYNLN